MSGLSRRAISAAVLAPIALAAAWFGGLVFAAFLAIAGLIMVWEWSRLVCGTRRRTLLLAGHAVAVVAAVAAAVSGWVAEGIVVVALIAAACALAAPARGGRGRLLLAFGVCYVSLPVLAAIVLRNDMAYGVWCMIWLLALTWATDTAAFFTGRTLGGPKLAPAISPKKTWSGAIGGTVAAFAFGLGFAAALDLANVWAVGAVSALLSVVGQVGDLFESAVKRRAGVKDSSSLIPGHGGVLDRLDSFLAASIVAWLIGTARSGGEHAASGVLLW